MMVVFEQNMGESRCFIQGYYTLILNLKWFVSCKNLSTKKLIEIRLRKKLREIIKLLEYELV